ncbi:MAG: crotonobetainyl-CoA:carnitine CoA-transferase CaiB-like acyl-CoA transferase [Crocinitomix sp.]|jgi:crotonobetainyl-CoA:carnitine CoA-transferase CaiB-like acyl-CoA transferase
MKQEFKHLKVVEIASVLAGPSVGLFFAELGAQVIKVENKKTGGDVTRSWKLPNEDKDASISAYYSAVNWHKQSIFMDFTNPTDQSQLKAHITDADIIIVNFKSGDAEKFNLDYPTLSKLNPNLIYGEITGFGHDSDRVAYDLILQAESGFMSMNGTPGSDPVKMPVALIDLLAGHQLKAGILTALYQRDAAQKGGCLVSVSLFDSAVASLANQASNWLMKAHIPKRMGSKHPNIAPYGEFFTTKDSCSITFAIGSNKQFMNLCKILHISELADHPHFENNAARVENRLSLASYLQDAVEQFERATLLSLLEAKFVPVAQIKNVKQVFESDAAQQLILKETIEGIETQRVQTAVFNISR